MIIGNFIGIGNYRGGQGYSEEYQAVLDAAGANEYTVPTSGESSAFDTFLTSLVASEVVPWAGWHTLNIYGFGSIEFGTLNLINPETYQHTSPDLSSVTFGAGQGVKSAGAGNSYLNTNYAVNEYAGIESDLTTILEVSESNETGSGQYAYGARVLAGASTPQYGLLPKASTTGTHHKYGNGRTFTSADHQALYVQTTQTTAAVIFRDGVKSSAATTFTAPDIANPVTLLAYNADTGGGVTLSGTSYYENFVRLFARYKGSWSDAMEAEFRTIYNAFLASI